MGRKKEVAIQGFPGAYHELAANAYFEEDVKIVPCRTFKDLFKTLAQGEAEFGMMAIENTVAGSLLPNYNLLRQSNLQVIGEYKLRISHSLCAMPGQNIDQIKEVTSHPMAIMQCEDFLDKHPNIKVLEHDDTALAAYEIADQKIMAKAAICSGYAAKKFGLKILASGIETNKKNFTRFLCIADTWNNPKAKPEGEINKASLVFTLPHEEGSLSKILTILSFYNINLTKIQSTPVIGHVWEYMFYIDLTFDDVVRYKQSLEAIKPLTANLKILGEYTLGKQSFDDITSR